MAQQDRSQEAIDRSKQLIDTYLTEPANDTIWHYTSLTGLLGILRSKRLWATNANYMNDATELDYGRSICVQFFKEIRWGDASLHDRLEALEKPDGAPPYDEFLVNRETFVTCFCRTPDLLSQWARYSNNGSGVAIGFRSRDVAELFRDHTLIRVKYDRVSQRGMLQEIRNKWFSLIRDLQEKDTNFSLAVLFRTMRTIIAAIKHPGFKEEQEVRLVVVPDRRNGLSERVEFREAPNMLIPYLVAPSDISTAISHVIVGPSLHRQLNWYSVKGLLATLGYSDKIDVTCSATPLR